VEITRRTDYAIRMLMALARVPEGQSCSARELSLVQRVPHPLARGILSELARAGFVKTRRGSGGGVELARPAADISVLSVVECLEGPVSLGLCTTDADYCDLVDACVMHRVWEEAEDQLRDLLANRSLAYLAAEGDTTWDRSEPSSGAHTEEVRP
jgi:Rrf2 family transcriptional regulator, nitric oxide-sensitive transcriptional repressor